MDIYQKKAKIINGVETFTDKEKYWGEVVESRMKNYINQIEKNNFSIFKSALFEEDSSLYDFIFNQVRADWRFCLPIKNNWQVLDIGAGLGANTFAIAKDVSGVYAFEQSFLRAKFLELRKKEEKQDNVHVAVANALDFPFKDNVFDLVVANGLFEWIGVTDKFKSVRDAQKNFLKDSLRVLKNDGYLYIGIENRFAVSYLFGGKDHNGLNFTSLMPRVIANLYTKIRTGKEYRTYTYSKSGYEKILKEAGFKNIKFYLVFPGYNFPKYIIPYEHINGIKFVFGKIVGGNGWRRRLMKKVIKFPLVARIWRFSFFSFAIFAQKIE